ncbi:lipoprotein insertase outer membrane protein LolB [Propionivibrio sp.]|uniref:lipoprotein insertase outer membrane protein LolB n=1 Tax=Propionivibrio sp. TaxID=2212460 RepID=UPI00272DFC17|nr:lipoprotein insertase outer membrane protein LolB [Propionivibrio sp.]
MCSFFLRALSRFVFVVSALLLAGCAALPTSAPESVALSRHALDDFVIEGRFSLRQNEQNHSGRLRWKHAGGSDEVLLASPFGQGVAEIVADARSASLTTSDGKTYSAVDAESLTEQVLGYRLPLSLLADWVRGRLVPEHVAERDASGRPLALRHEDWRVDYEYDSDAPDALPGRLFAERVGVFELRLRIDEWTRLP